MVISPALRISRSSGQDAARCVVSATEKGWVSAMEVRNNTSVGLRPPLRFALLLHPASRLLRTTGGGI